ncbi:MAG TPA: hypothetical protein VFM98_25855 [Ramlibacter sp.]|uniref:hypothetical protein n=1 Tax=Ramlibacter sp. TaxID=1917967 RepID=UPI002D7EB2C5|nr:hypothetical protein [Ramlibacter sp.]HET8749044.1 hypothetical protein [Ramlibacter sp.]
MRWLLALWLAAWWWCLGLVLGAYVNTWVHQLTGGGWGAPFVVLVPRMARAMPWLLLGLLPVALGAGILYPWARDPSWLGALAHPDFPSLWLAQPFFTLRLVIYAAGWWCITRPWMLARKGRTAAALVLYTVITSLAAVDLLASLVPGWYSTAFGLVAMSVQALSGAALATLLAVRAELAVPWRDLGNLQLMWVMSWAYLAFMQFLIIWAENLPREIAWYLPRLSGGWQYAALALVLAQLVLPFLALLLRRVKDDPAQLRWVAAWLLAATAFDALWMVLPSLGVVGVRR